MAAFGDVQRTLTLTLTGPAAVVNETVTRIVQSTNEPLRDAQRAGARVKFSFQMDYVDETGRVITGELVELARARKGI